MKPPLFFAILILLVSFPCAVSAAGINCLKCHKKLTKGTSVHPALSMGCSTCHSALDAKSIPHKRSSAIAHGLSAEQPELCYGCHDQAMFTKKDAHPAINMGCTSCHNPHSSKNAKLLVSNPPALCFTCHDKAGFSKKTAHPPVAAGRCLACHVPHSSDEMALLAKKPMDACLQCHQRIAHGQHTPAMAIREVRDPARPGKPLYCGSCHDPHGSDSPLMFRFDVKKTKDLCLHCHKM
jgi:predicted CXXCH cytochrome family protein